MTTTTVTTSTYHTYYCVASVRIFVDYTTHMTEIQAYIGTAPDSTTIITYPYRKYECGYWNKGTARANAKRMKADLLAYVKANSVKLSRALEYSERWA